VHCHRNLGTVTLGVRVKGVAAMKIYNAKLIISENDDGTGGSIYSMDVIEHEDYFGWYQNGLITQHKG